MIEGERYCQNIISDISCLKLGEIYCATTINIPADPELLPICNNGSTDYPSWFSFKAKETKLDIKLCPANCQGVPGGFMGIQAAIYSGCPGSINNVVVCQGSCQTECFHLITDALTIGETYFLMLDGCAGDVCDVTIECVQGCNTFISQPVSEIGGPTNICLGDSITMHALSNSCDFTFYTWIVDGVVQTHSKKELPIVFSSPGVHEVCAEGFHDPKDTVGLQNSICKLIKVDSIPIHIGITGPQSICPQEIASFTALNGTCPSLYTHWTVNGVPSDSIQNILKIQFDTTGIYQICGKAFNNIQDTMNSVAPICLTVEVKELGPYQITLPDMYICKDTMFEIKNVIILGKIDTILNYVISLSGQNNACDTTLLLKVIGGSEKEVTIPTRYQCKGEPLYLDGKIYSQCGMYQTIIPQKFAPFCDSIIHFDLKIVDSDPLFIAPDFITKTQSTILLDGSLSAATLCGEFVNTNQLVYAWTLNDLFSFVVDTPIFEYPFPDTGTYCLTLWVKEDSTLIECHKKFCKKVDFISATNQPNESNDDDNVTLLLPANHLLHLPEQWLSSDIKIFSVDGRLIFSQKNMMEDISLKQLPPGLYPCVIQSQDGQVKHIRIYKAI